jgi:AGCS family alanine or glycine:cation symporter
MEFLTNAFGRLDAITWGWALIPILVVLGIYFTLTTGFVQFRYFGRMFKLAHPRHNEARPGQLSGWDALMVSVGGRVGSGNLAGVAVAIATGGPGAVFWMWAIAVAGMATSLIECTLAQTFKRITPEGTFRGGPAAYIRHGLGANYRWLVIVYAVCLLASFGLGFNAFQGNTIASAVHDSFGVPHLATGLVLGVITALIVFGGIRRIAQASDVIVPVMCLAYIVVAVVVIVMNIGELPRVLGVIVANAFGWQEAVSGGMGAAIAAGLKRGLFSNEAGLGSAPNVAATADVKHPVSQGITQSLSVFIDTLVICSATAFIILLGDVYKPGAELSGAPLLQQSLVGHLGSWAQYFLTFIVFLFAFSSIIYNYYLGETAMAELSTSKAATLVLRALVIGCVVLGAAAPKATSVFFFSDPMMGLLAIVNLMVIITLLPVVLRLLADYRQQLARGEAIPRFEPERFPDLDVDRSAWK